MRTLIHLLDSIPPNSENTDDPGPFFFKVLIVLIAGFSLAIILLVAIMFHNYQG